VRLISKFIMAFTFHVKLTMCLNYTISMVPILFILIDLNYIIMLLMFLYTIALNFSISLLSIDLISDVRVALLLAVFIFMNENFTTGLTNSNVNC
jgi:hypothetical protein